MKPKTKPTAVDLAQERILKLSNDLSKPGPRDGTAKDWQLVAAWHKREAMDLQNRLNAILGSVSAVTVAMNIFAMATGEFQSWLDREKAARK